MKKIILVLLLIAVSCFSQTKTEDIELVNLKAHYVQNVENSPLRLVNYFATLNIAEKNESCVINFIIAEPFFFNSQDEFNDWYAVLKNTVILTYNSFPVHNYYYSPTKGYIWYKSSTGEFNAGVKLDYSGNVFHKYDSAAVGFKWILPDANDTNYIGVKPLIVKPSGQGHREIQAEPDSTNLKMYMADREYFMKLQETVGSKNQYIGLQWCIDLLSKYIAIEEKRLGNLNK